MDNGQQALDALDESNIDLIVMDMQMPVMGGIEAAKLYNYTTPAEHRKPIIILTANATKEAQKQCEDANVDGYLTKPIVAKKLLSTIDEVSNKNNIYGDHSVPNFLENKVSQIEEVYKKYKNETAKKIGVINHIIKFCDHMSIMSSHLKERLQEKGIQVLNLERDYSRANKGQLSTRIEAFMEMM